MLIDHLLLWFGYCFIHISCYYIMFHHTRIDLSINIGFDSSKKKWNEFNIVLWHIYIFHPTFCNITGYENWLLMPLTTLFEIIHYTDIPMRGSNSYIIYTAMSITIVDWHLQIPNNCSCTYTSLFNFCKLDLTRYLETAWLIYILFCHLYRAMITTY